MSFSNIYANTCVQLHNLHLLYSSSMFTEEDGTAINKEDKRILS